MPRLMLGTLFDEDRKYKEHCLTKTESKCVHVLSGCCIDLEYMINAVAYERLQGIF